MPQQFPITAGDPATRFTLPSGFVSVKVDNPTAQWLHLLDTFSYVPPGAIGAIFTLDGLPNPGAEWVAPPGVTQPGATTGQQAALTYYEVALPPTAGTVIQVTSTVSGSVSVSNTPNVSVTNTPGVTVSNTPNVSVSNTPGVTVSNQPTITGITNTVNTNSPQSALTPVSDATGSGTTTNVPTSLGAQAIAVQITDTTKIAHLKIVGHITQATYLELFFFSQSIYAFPYLAARDSSVDITVQSTAGGTTATVNPVELRESVPEFLQLYAPPQLSANQPALAIDALVIAAAGTSQLIAEVSNVQILLFQSVIQASGTNQFRLWGGTAGTPKQQKLASFYLANYSGPVPFSGDPVTRGLGLYLENTGAGSGTYYGTISYSKT